MKTFFNIILFVLVTLFNTGCSTEKKEIKADTEIAAIEQLINNNFYNLARIKIDSFHIKYRMFVDKRRIVAALEDTVSLRESYRTIEYCDTVIPKLKQQLDSMMKYFRFEKDTVFQETGDYVHKLQITELNVNRNYLKVKIDENGELKLFSYVKGMKIGHKSIKVSTGDLFAETDTLMQKNFSQHDFNDGENYFETVIFGGKSVENIVKFIYDNQTSKLKVTLEGNREYAYFLSQNEIKAVADSYHFWIVKRDLVKLEKQLKSSELKILRIKSNNNNQFN